MDRNYWENIALNYNKEIFDVYRNDKTGIIRAAIQEYGSTTKTVMDIGCAVGKWIPFLSIQFKKVIATDISATNIEIAKKNNKAFTNVEYIRADMSDAKLKIATADFGVCINAILTGEVKKRITFFTSLHKCIKKGGTLILVVPSLESSMYTSIVRHRWKVDQQQQSRSASIQRRAAGFDNMQQGNVDIDNVPTKHYLREELVLLLEKEGFHVQNVQKVEYNWKTEFVSPPRWLKEPYPWDWMCIAKRK